MRRRGGPTQEERVLRALTDANGGWINGQYFLREMMLSQYHAVIFRLEEQGHQIEHSTFTDEHGFKSYRLGARVEYPEAVFERMPDEPEPVDL